MDQILKSVKWFCGSSVLSLDLSLRVFGNGWRLLRYTFFGERSPREGDFSAMKEFDQFIIESNLFSHNS